MPIDVMTPGECYRLPQAQSEYVRELEEDIRTCCEQVRAYMQKIVTCHKNYYDRKKHEVRYDSEDLVLLKKVVFLPFQRKFQDRYEGPRAVIEVLPGNCYRIQRQENSKPEVVHHDRLKPYRARNVNEHNTDWVKRVREHYAAVRSEAPWFVIQPSSGEASDQNDSETEHELLREVEPYDDGLEQSQDSEIAPETTANVNVAEYVSKTSFIEISTAKNTTYMSCVT